MGDRRTRPQNPRLNRKGPRSITCLPSPHALSTSAYTVMPPSTAGTSPVTLGERSLAYDLVPARKSTGLVVSSIRTPIRSRNPRHCSSTPKNGSAPSPLGIPFSRRARHSSRSSSHRLSRRYTSWMRASGFGMIQTFLSFLLWYPTHYVILTTPMRTIPRPSLYFLSRMNEVLNRCPPAAKMSLLPGYRW